MKSKKSFVIYENWAIMLANLPADQAGKLIKAMCQFQQGEDPAIDDDAVKAMYLSMVPKMQEDKDNYQNTCEKASSSARSRYAKKKEDKKPSEDANAVPTHANAVPTHGDNDTDTDNDNKNKRESVREKRERFSPPTPDQVREYAKQAGLIIDAEAFVDYYAKDGWKTTKGPMTDWKAAVRNWVRKDRQFSQEKQTARSGTRGNFCAYDHEQTDWNAAAMMIAASQKAESG